MKILSAVIALILTMLSVSSCFAENPTNQDADHNSLREIMIQQIQSECNEALEMSLNLTTIPNSDSFHTLSFTCSHLYAIQVLNDTYSKVYSSQLISKEANDQIDEILMMLEQHYKDWQAASDTKLLITEIRIKLTELQQDLNNIM